MTIKIIHNIKLGEYDNTDREMIENFMLRVNMLDASEIKDVTFTLYKGAFPLEAVIHYKEDNNYTSFNLYYNGLRIHNSGYTCSTKQFEESIQYIRNESY